MFEYGTLKTIKAVIRRESGKREHNGKDVPIWDALYAYMEMPQKNPCTTTIY
jgi:hypothetical protein